ncbi:MAG TPA: GNAT family N-acetyltransferase [Candidatus Limiplasma sp.]|nr:GNAT family N-acetyltransferase [Candidatus Limiplasma sp.]
MRFTQYETAEAFSKDVLDSLNRHAIQNNLLYRNIGDGKVMLTVKDDTGHVLLIADRTPPHPLVMYEHDNRHSEAVVAFFARSLYERNIDIDFLFTEDQLAQSFIRHYAAVSGKRFHPEQRLALSVTDHATPPGRMTPGRLRLATQDDLYYLPHWCADFNVACAIGAYDLQAGVENAKKLVEEQQLYVWEDGIPVSIAASHRKVTGCLIIGYVYTPPQLRGKGYASACVYTLTRDLLTDEYPQCALYIDCDNPVSNHIYEHIGYRRIGIHQQYRETPPTP